MTAATTATFASQTEVAVIAAIAHAGIIHTVNNHTNDASVYDSNLCLTVANADCLSLI